VCTAANRLIRQLAQGPPVALAQSCAKPDQTKVDPERTIGPIGMSTPAPPSNGQAAAADVWGSFEPYVQLVRSLLPRATAIAVFDSQGVLRWSSDVTTGPDLINAVDDALSGAAANPDSPGQLRMLDGNVPVYLCCVRDAAARLLAILSVTCRPGPDQEAQSRGFAFAHAILRPALECLRRDLIARAAIDQLHRTVRALDKDLELLLADGTGSRDPTSADGADELNNILQQGVEHLRCSTAALIVPDKSIALVRVGEPRSDESRATDTQLLARTHRQLLSMAQLRREPVIINKLPANSPVAILPYRILSCALRSSAGRTIGVLALFRDMRGEELSDRDARIGDILARKAVGVIESSYDNLTGLYMRPAFEQRVRGVAADKSRSRAWSALYVDVDQLHVINDNFGMHVGDTVLAQLGELVRGRLPPGAFGARISGDRFALLLPTQLEDAESFADSLCRAAEQLGARHESSRLHTSISIGVALLDNTGGELMHSLAAAETACKAAKDRGRNRVEVYHSNDLSLVRRVADINIAGTLRQALEEGRFRLDAQLILPFAGAERARPHYELLLRMIEDDGRTIGPERFMSAATRYQLMPVIDRWVIDKAIAMLKPQAALLASKAVSFAINFSGQSLNDDGFADLLVERVTHSGLDPELFCFELTENATIASIARAEALIQRLRRLGCGVALDDFGTGLSSLSYLRQLPVTLLKIDGSFVRDVLKDPRAESMVRAIAQLARSMSIATVAEYVETEEIRTRVATLGVDYGQGFAIGRPAPLADLLAELPVIVAADTSPRLLAQSVMASADLMH
jgi:diguanylate cyclase (GGDEF)-like protein